MENRFEAKILRQTTMFTFIDIFYSLIFCCRFCFAVLKKNEFFICFSLFWCLLASFDIVCFQASGCFTKDMCEQEICGSMLFFQHCYCTNAIFYWKSKI